MKLPTRTLLAWYRSPLRSMVNDYGEPINRHVTLETVNGMLTVTETRSVGRLYRARMTARYCTSWDGSFYRSGNTTGTNNI